ncbi:calcium-independent phospholipase A2-gamma isoform X1 [Ornithorhynchus anatinus]|uniref:Patatin like phospholipase domain containing 8 n=1 Tax=Ornithorhynchus anatinus TaxID=9258 RepID=A0A6I8NWY5_ORNAN|nr:calcium-independent phospholipase A2-gamma isoform X1 [Ornithorhynchus anatinus]XP_039769133.1 calcium-independent phospholipase A2-gamma isoform X1 [Ornithorhynchus anatinus]
MSFNLTIDIYIYLCNTRSLWVKQRNKQVYFLNIPKFYWSVCPSYPRRGFHTRKTQCKWTQREINSSDKLCYMQDGQDSQIGVLKFSTSAPKGLTKVSVYMSRIKNTLDSVSKAVFGNQNEMILRLARFKPSSGILRKASENARLSQEKGKQAPGVKTPQDSSANPKEESHFYENGTSDSSLETTNDFDQVLEDSEKNKGYLFHISCFATNFGESFNFLSNHINSYFIGDKNMAQEMEDKPAPVDSKGEDRKDEVESRNGSSEYSVSNNEKVTVSDSPSITKTDPIESTETLDVHTISTKQSIAHFLSHPSNSVQALVGGYIGGLVPRLRAEPKGHSEEREEVVGAAEQVSGKEKSSEEKRRLSLQREKIIARVSVDNRTRAIVQALRRTTDHKLCINRVEELTFHLLEFPETRGVAVKEKIIPYLLRLRQTKDEYLQAAVREALALIGYTDPVKGRGFRILTIDGGGTRGVVALQTLRKLVELTGKPVHQLFDYICGVSTGAILAFMLGLFHMSLDECEELYRKLGSDVFSQNVIVGTVKMGWSHAFYDSQIWEKILKEKVGSQLMIETARNPHCPKVAAVSTIVSRGTPLKAFVFRNYSHFPGVKSHYMGSCRYKLWQAIRASSAAPGYFAEYALDKDLHQDGGLLLNNPAALAMHECKCLWPDVPLQCIVSLGTGRYEGDRKTNVTYTSLKTKLTHVISSATDTEEVHIMLDGLLPSDTYFRFNPVMHEDIPLDESRNEKLDQLQLEGLRYLERNEEKVRKAAKTLTQEKTTMQKITDWLKLKADMYEGLPLTSKL